MSPLIRDEADRTLLAWPAQLRPLALVSGPAQLLAAAACLIALAVVFAGNLALGGGDELGALLVLPVLAAAWLLSGPMLALVLAVAILNRFAAAALGLERPAAAISSAVAIALAATAGRLAAVNLAVSVRSAARATMIARVARIATSAVSLQEVLDGILAEMAREGLRGGLIGLIDERDRIYPAAAEGDLSEEVWNSRIPVGQGIMGTVAAEGRAVLISDLDDPSLPVRPVNRSLGSNSRLKSMLVVPLLAAGRVIGVIEIDSGQPNRFDQADLAVLEQVALAISGAVQREGALKLADVLLQKRVRELTLLLDAARELAGSLDPEVVLGRVLSGAEAALSGGRAALIRVNDDQLIDILEHDRETIRARPLHLALAFAPPALLRVMANAGIQTSAESAGSESELLPEGARSCVWAPIRVGGQLHGVLLVSGDEADGLDPGTLRLVEGVAYLAGLALGNAGRLELERRRGLELREHADRMANLEKIKADFLKVASHELRGPLAVLRGYVSMLADGSISDPSVLQRILGILGGKLGEINDLVEQMLETARLEDSQLHLQLRRLNLAEIVAGAADRVRERVDENHRLVIEGTETQVPVLVDQARLTTILLNLIDNALKYSPNGGDVGLRVAVEAGFARVQVSDEGLGIAAEDMPRLFTRFGRIVTSENSHIPGTGLGLYLAREMARLHGGEITGISAVGKGSTFELALPLAAEKAPAELTATKT